jgi:hypothetical protein
MIGGWGWLDAQQRAGERRLAGAEGGARIVLRRAHESGGDIAAWAEARTTVAGLVTLRDTVHARPDTRARVDGLVAEVERDFAAVSAEVEATHRDQDLLDRIVQARNLRGEVGTSGTILAFADAFSRYGLDLADVSSSVAVADRLANRPESVRVAAASGLDEWAILARSQGDLSFPKSR